MSRERNEGLSDSYAYVIKMGYNFPKSSLKSSVAYGYFDLPDINDPAANKYGMPSYHQMNFDLRYDFKGFLNGLGAQFLYVHKFKSGKEPLSPSNLINKVDMGLWNLVLNYNF